MIKKIKEENSGYYSYCGLHLAARNEDKGQISFKKILEAFLSLLLLLLGVVHKLRYAFEVGGWSEKYNNRKL